MTLGGCAYEPPPEVRVMPPAEGVFYAGDTVQLRFSVPVVPESVAVRVWPDQRDIELNLLPGMTPLLDTCAATAVQCGTNTATLVEGNTTLELAFDPAGVGRPDVPILLEVLPGLEDAATGAVTGTSLWYSLQFKPVEQIAAPVDFDEGYYVVLSVIEQPVPTVMTMLTHLKRGPDNRVALAGAEADTVTPDTPVNTTRAADLVVDETDQGFVIFAYATLRESEAGERFFETDPFLFELRLGPIIARVNGTRLTGKIVDDVESEHDRIEGTMSYDSITLDIGNGDPYDYEAGSATFVAAWAPPEELALGVPDICGEQCGWVTAQCFPPAGFPSEGFCGEDEGAIEE